MQIKSAKAGILALGIALAAGCSGPADTPADEAAAPAETATPTPEATPAEPSPTPTTEVADLDFAALQDRQDPDHLLRFYAAAVEAGRWDAAAAAWSSNADIDAEVLRKNYDAEGNGLTLAFGTGDIEGAAGSLYYEAPVTAQTADGVGVRRGTIVLRRIDDVPGASEEQLNWRIERSTLVTKR